MQQARGAPGGFRHLDDIEAEGRRLYPQAPQISQRRCAQHSLLSAVDREVTRYERRVGPGLDLDKHHDLTVSTDQIDLLSLVAGIAPVSGHDPQAPFHQKVSGGVLTGGPRRWSRRTTGEPATDESPHEGVRRIARKRFLIAA